MKKNESIPILIQIISAAKELSDSCEEWDNLGSESADNGIYEGGQRYNKKAKKKLDKLLSTCGIVPDHAQAACCLQPIIWR